MKESDYEPLKYSAKSRSIGKNALIELLQHASETVKKTEGKWFYFNIEIKERV